MKNSSDLVSVIMPSYNSAKTIQQAINSVKLQSYPNWELLIVDDFSQDNTVRLVQKLAEGEPRIKLLQLKKNSGAAVARNEAISQAKGRFIAFLDADDRWLGNKLETQIAFMLSQDVALCYSGYHLLRDGHRTGTFIPPTETSYRELLKTCVIGCLTAVYDVEKVGKRYMPLIRKRQDFALWLDILRDGACARGLPTALAEYSLEGGMSQKKHKVLKYQWAIYRDIEQLSYPMSCYYFFCYAINGLLKYNKAQSSQSKHIRDHL